MRAKSIITLLIALSLMSMVYFAFSIHRFLPLRQQWLYPLAIVATLGVLFFMVLRLLRRMIKSHSTSVVATLFVLLLFCAGLYQISSIKRESEASLFLKQNEQKLEELISVARHGGENEQVSALFKDLNILLIKENDETFRLELYRFVGYGYGILFTANDAFQKPRSIGMSPTVSWYPLESNWFYYSYFD